MDPSKNSKEWVESAVDNKFIINFDYNLFGDIELISTTLSNVKKAYLKGLDINVILKYLKDDKYKDDDEYYKNFVREVCLFILYSTLCKIKILLKFI
jgi:hypothetical protein